MIGLSGVDTVLMRHLSFKEDDMTVMRSFSFKQSEPESLPTPKRASKIVLDHSPSFKNWEPETKLEPSLSFKSQSLDANQSGCDAENKADNVTLSVGAAEVPLYQPIISPRPKSRHDEFSPKLHNVYNSYRSKRIVAEENRPVCDTKKEVDNAVVPAVAAEKPLYQLLSPRPKKELDEFATKVQKVYKSYRTRRNLADAAVIIEEYWWQALDYASLNINSVSFYHDGQPEKAVSRWSRAKKRLAKVGKGLSKDEKAQKLALQHWLEAIDPRHRYGHNLHFYYDVWFNSESTQPFFFWLDAGDGKKFEHEKIPRVRLQSQIIKYLGPTEREAYEVVVVEGRLIYKKEQLPVDTTEGSKWIFVLSTSRILYVGMKQKGTFQHSSFLAGAATTAAGRLVAKDGYLQAVWPYSGHYLPTQENFLEFISFLVDNNVDISAVKRCSVDDDEFPSFRKPDSVDISTSSSGGTDAVEAARVATPKWSTGAGARIGCVRDYPEDLQLKALQHVHLSPRGPPSAVENNLPIPSPRPSPKMRVSPQLSRLGFSPTGYTGQFQLVTLDNGSPKVIVSPIGNKIPTTSPRRSPVARLSPRMSPAGFPSPKVTLRLPSLKARRRH